MALVPIIELAIGPVNGVNKIFSSSGSYVPGSVRVFRNGLLNRKADTDGWVELGSKKVRLNETPKIGDVIKLYYLRA